jgi:hypothetical protein
MKKLALAVLLVTACDDTQLDDADDHAADRLVLEGPEIAELLGDDRISDPIASTDGFRRLGILWDATEEGALEARTSLDGIVWSAWTAPQVVSLEMIAHAGHLDAISGIGAGGSTDADPRASYYQLRVPEGRALPTFVVIEPLVDIPPAFEDEVVVEESDAQTIIEASTPIGSVTIHSRKEWGARAPRCSGGQMTPNRATIHHTVTPTVDSLTVPQRLRQIQSFHQDSRGWCDIGYNYLVSRDGRVWRGRGAKTIGAHVANSNTGNVGVSFIGTYTSTAPTETQMCNAARLLRRLHEDFGGVSLNRTDVKGHRQYGGTSCPGDALYSRIDKILRKSRNGCSAD